MIILLVARVTSERSLSSPIGFSSESNWMPLNPRHYDPLEIGTRKKENYYLVWKYVTFDYNCYCGFFFRVQLAMAKNYSENLALCRLPNNMSDYDAQHPCDPQKDSDFVYWEKNYNGDTDDVLGTVTYQSANGSTPDHIATEYAYKPVRPGRLVTHLIALILSKIMKREKI